MAYLESLASFGRTFICSLSFFLLQFLDTKTWRGKWVVPELGPVVHSKMTCLQSTFLSPFLSKPNYWSLFWTLSPYFNRSTLRFIPDKANGFVCFLSQLKNGKFISFLFFSSFTPTHMRNHTRAWRFVTYLPSYWAIYIIRILLVNCHFCCFLSLVRPEKMLSLIIPNFLDLGCGLRLYREAHNGPKTLHK